MIVADELGADFDQVKIAFATGDETHIHPLLYPGEQVTGGSASIMGFGPVMRKAAAAAREMLTQAAASALSEDTSSLEVLESTIRSKVTGTSVAFMDVLAEAAQLPVPAEPMLLPAANRRLVGAKTIRKDAREKVMGTAVFGVDVEVPGMVYATVRQAPDFGGDVEQMDVAEASSMPGVIGVFPIPNGYGVVAEQFWQAVTALDAVDVVWQRGTQTFNSSKAFVKELHRLIDEEPGVPVGEHTEGQGSSEDATYPLTATYDVPFLAHATMEPMNATAHVTDEGIEVWVPSQTPTLDRQLVADALGRRPEEVTIYLTYAGGGFGRRGSSEYAVQAAMLSQAVGRPVKVIWTREEDTRQDFYRPAFAARLSGAITPKGRITRMSTKVAGPGVWSYNRPMIVQAMGGVDELAVEGAHDVRYAIGQFDLTHAAIKPMRRIGYWRSIGYSHNIYFIESMVDELAHSVGADPLQVRLDLLEDDPRSRTVLEAAARQAGWYDTPKPGRHLGVGFFAADRWQTRIAQIADVSLADGRIKVNRVTVAADVGEAINPLSVEAQIQGAVNFALSSVLYGQIDVEDGQVLQSSFPDYPVVTLQDAPQIDVIIIEGGGGPGGVGEIGVPPLAPAITNAVFAATGQRIRGLPLAKHGLA